MTWPICSHPMRDGVTLWHCMSSVGCMHRKILGHPLDLPRGWPSFVLWEQSLIYLCHHNIISYCIILWQHLTTYFIFIRSESISSLKLQLVKKNNDTTISRKFGKNYQYSCIETVLTDYFLAKHHTKLIRCLYCKLIQKSPSICQYWLALITTNNL